MRLKNFRNKGSLPGWVPVFVLLLMMVSHSISAFQDASFNPTNGDYQTYDAVRRLLDGQKIGVDFQAYLGVGVNYFVTFFVAMTSGSLVASKMVVLALCFALCTLLVGTVFYLLYGKWKDSLWYTMVFVGAVYFGLLPLVDDDFLEPLNSLAPIRIFLPTILVLLLLLCEKIQKTYFPDKFPLFFPLCLGGLLGISRYWSNDVSLSTIVSGVFLYFLFYGYKDFLKKFVVLFGAYALCFFAFGFFALGEGFSSWVEYNSVFGTVSEYQKWYYSAGIDKTYTLYHIYELFLWQPFHHLLAECYVLYRLGRYFYDPERRNSGKVIASCPQLSPYLVCIGLPKKKISSSDFYLTFIALTYFVANSVYYIQARTIFRYSSIFSFFFFAVVFYELGQWIHGRWKKKNAGRLDKNFLVTVQNCAMAWAVVLLGLTLGQGQKYLVENQKNETYMEIFQGNCKFEPHLREYQEIIGDGKVFSTYATALEVVLDSYQPTGVDYIIHVLGDQPRVEYLETFHQYDADFVATVADKYTGDWGTWSLESNWFWTREMMETYRFLDTEGYLDLWEKTEETLSVPVPEDLEIHWDGTYLRVDCPSYPLAVVDISLSYSVEGSSVLSFLGNQITVDHERHRWAYGLSGGVDQFHYLPVYLDEEGRGFLEITAQPEGIAQLEVHEFMAIKLFPVSGEV